jgi:Tfp pilus assembly protein PilF
MLSTITTRTWIAVILVCGFAVAHAFSESRDPLQADISSADVEQLRIAREARKAERYDQAISLLEPLVRKTPQFYNAQLNLAFTYLEQEKYQEAAPAFERAFKIRERYHIPDLSLPNTIGWTYMQLGEYHTAEKFLKQAAANEQQNGERLNRLVFNNLGLLYLYSNDLDQAELFLKKAIGYGNSGAEQNLQIVQESRETQVGSRARDTGTNLATLKQHIKWSIYQGGARIWSNGELRSAEDLRAELLRPQQPLGQGHKEIEKANPAVLVEATKQAVREMPEEKPVKRLPDLLAESCKDPGARVKFIKLANQGEAARARDLFAKTHGTEVANLPGAFSDNDFATLIRKACGDSG